MKNDNQISMQELKKHVCLNPYYHDKTAPIVDVCMRFLGRWYTITICVSSFTSRDELLQFCQKAVKDCDMWMFGLSNYPAWFQGNHSIQFDDIIKFFSLEDDDRTAIWEFINKVEKYYPVDYVLDIIRKKRAAKIKANQ